ncbi:MAG: exodeoxyribonuclease V subunit gamma [Alcanivorax sp.]|nr:MAG: exodeoxyribonuclease V subunit gamma [Alcanivorax sp.]
MHNGFMVLHGNRLETLTELVVDWLRQHPLAPLDEEIFLVQSNGMAQWLKLQLAGALGISAGFQFQMPARFQRLPTSVRAPGKN